jgi:hypothetical protein
MVCSLKIGPAGVTLARTATGAAYVEGACCGYGDLAAMDLKWKGRVGLKF